MEIRTLHLTGVRLPVPQHHGDKRDYFAETFLGDLFAHDIDDYSFVEGNESRSASAGTACGLHFQAGPPYAQGKVVRCAASAPFAVDLRAGTFSYDQWTSKTLPPDNGEQLRVLPFLPTVFAHWGLMRSSAPR